MPSSLPGTGASRSEPDGCFRASRKPSECTSPSVPESPSGTPSGAPHTPPQVVASTEEQCWIIIGDVHGDLGLLPHLPEVSEATGLIIAGDISRQGGIAEAQQVIADAQALVPVVLAQIGNIDRPELDEWLERKGINLHCKVRELTPAIAVMGVGGSTFTPFGTPSEFPEARFAEWLESLAKLAAGHTSLIVISHNPPYDTVCDALAEGGHAGSKALREFIEEFQPDLCLCGHIHEAFGQQMIGRTKVMNPGAFAAGGYIVLRTGERLSAQLCRLKRPAAG